ncbi:MAG: hypothetical protein PVJ55_11010 [Anaerolineae bacterium]|jgi:formate hydrogenlyase subunit 3/multisubunit Na+/H+ antiporter MnhD subunit
MLDLMVISVALPLLSGMGIFALSLLFSISEISRRRVWIFAAILVAVVAVLALLTRGSVTGRGIALSSLYPSLLAESAVEMRWDVALWPLGLSLSLSIVALVLGADGWGDQSLRPAAFLLMLLATGLTTVWSANPLTTLVCWAFYDLGLVLAQLAAGGSGEDALRSLIVGTGAAALLWIGVLVAGAGMGSVPWELVPPGGTKMTVWMLAAFLRLGLYPLHLTVPRGGRSPSAIAAAQSLSPVLGWALLLRLALVSDVALPEARWMAIPAVVTLVAGGVLAWTTDSARDSRPWISMGGSGSVLLAAVLSSVLSFGGGSSGSAPVVATVVTGATAWILYTALIFLGGGFDLRETLEGRHLWRQIPSLFGAVSIIGLPATAGFFVQSVLMRDLIVVGRWGWAVGFLIGQAFLVAAVMRWLLAPILVTRARSGVASEVAYGVGLGGLAAALAVVGVVPGRLLLGIDPSHGVSLRSLLAGPGLTGWLLWGGSILLGGGLAWFDEAIRPRVSLWLGALHDVVRLDWAYRLVSGAFEQGFAILRVLDDILGGKAALLWSCIVLLVFVLVGGL